MSVAARNPAYDRSRLDTGTVKRLWMLVTTGHVQNPPAIKFENRLRIEGKG